MLRVLIVEDQPAAAEVTGRLRGAGAPASTWPARPPPAPTASGSSAAGAVDLILLDIHLPDMSGLEVLRRIRAAGSTVDVIVVTQARDLSVVQAAVSFGSMQYLIKPFTFAAVRQKLERYQEYRSMLAENDLVLVQQEVDRLMHTLREPDGRRPAQGHQLGVAAGGRGRAAGVRGVRAGCPRRRWPARPARPG